MATQTETTEGAIIKDRELKSLNKIIKELASLSADELSRVVWYINRRFGPAPESNGQ